MSDEESIFGEALRRESPRERAAFLDQACGGDATLRLEIEALLSAHESAGADAFLRSPAVGLEAHLADADAATAAPTQQPGSIVGPYKLLEQIGEGGMGVVFMAEQLHPVRRRVALKIIKPGLDTKQVIARFEAERQALAMMEHPNIAKIFDAGATKAGRPYFVMELVRGIPLTEYCDQNQLTVRDRLTLFVQVCQAVQHAHTKGIIHRDLKPTNVLVTLHDGRPVPKVIDFGIAKATAGQSLTEWTLFTEFRQLVGTPLYMSPEQAAMSALDVDTRSDVYSLGVLLYELLTGTTPFDKQRLAKAAHDEVRRIIREEEPPRPSTRISTLGETLTMVSAQRQTDPKKLGAVMRRELDWIVLCALEKDRTRRYETANGLARDVERYLTDQPVEACPPSRVYRMRKVIRRHRAAITTAAVIAVVLILATGVSTWQALRATRAERLVTRERDQVAAEKHRADEQATIARTVNDFLNQDLLSQASPFNQVHTDRKVVPERDLKVRDALDRAAKRIGDRFKDQPLIEAAIRWTIGDAYDDLGEYDKAKDQLDSALRLRRQASGDHDPSTLQAVDRLCQVYNHQQEYGKAEALAQQVLEQTRKALGERDGATRARLRNLANVFYYQGHYDKAQPLYSQLLEESRTVMGPHDPETLSAMNDVAACYGVTRQYDKAEPLFVEVVKADRNSLGPQHPATIQAVHDLGRIYYEQRKYELAEPLYLQVLEARRKDLGNQNEETLDIIESLIFQYRQLDDHYIKAAPLIVEYAQSAPKLYGEQSQKAHWARLQLTDLYRFQGRDADVEPILRDRAQRLLADTPTTQVREGATIAVTQLADCYRRLGQAQNAAIWEQKLREFLEANIAAKSAELQRLKPDDHKAILPLASRAASYKCLGRFREALIDCRRELELSPMDSPSRCTSAALQVYLGDEQAYRATCRELLRQFDEQAGKASFARASLTANALLFAPGAVDDFSAVVRVVERAVATRNIPADLCYAQLTAGQAAYRGGNFDSAVELLTKSRQGFAEKASQLDSDTTPCDEGLIRATAFLAMAEHRRGRTEQARQALAAAREQLQTKLPPINRPGSKIGSSEWLAAHIAVREAETLIGAESAATTSPDGRTVSSAPPATTTSPVK